jgi:hypothetical protein
MDGESKLLGGGGGSSFVGPPSRARHARSESRTLPLPPGRLAALLLPMPFRRPLLHLPPVPLCTLHPSSSSTKRRLLLFCQHSEMVGHRLFLCHMSPIACACPWNVP